jgi:cytoskeletal protein CcmA (bactofilin family)
MSVEPRPFLGAGAAFEGKVSFTGTLRIDGHLRGTARSTGTLVVGQPGLVEADLDVAVLIVHGSVSGAVRAQERIEVGRSIGPAPPHRGSGARSFRGRGGRRAAPSSEGIA